MTRRPTWGSKRSSSGPSTLHLRDEAARAIAERVDRWHREVERATTGKARAAALEKLGADLGPLAARYRETDRTHQSLTVDSIAIADGAGLLERLHKAPYDSPQRKRVEAAADKWLTTPAQRVRVGAEGRPVVLRIARECLYGSREGRCEYALLEESLRSPRAETFEPFIGPEMPPPTGYMDGCYCARRHADLVDCPDAKPCRGGCGRFTGDGYICRFCTYPKWEAAAWLVSGYQGRAGRPREQAAAKGGA